MRSLTLLRHAKTETDSATGDDFDRVLTERGRGNATRLGEELRALGLDYDLVLSSPAARAVETVERLGGLSVKFGEAIYNASPGELMEIVRALPSEAARVMLVGHNPGFEGLAGMLAPGAVTDMPTCALAEIELPIENWDELGEGSGTLVRFIDPKELD